MYRFLDFTSEAVLVCFESGTENTICFVSRMRDSLNVAAPNAESPLREQPLAVPSEKDAYVNHPLTEGAAEDLEMRQPQLLIRCVSVEVPVPYMHLDVDEDA